jgi:hypothetical protein
MDMAATFDLSTARELDARSNDGVDVRLWWHPDTNRVAVEVTDQRCGDHFVLGIEPVDALEAFRHPFAYAVTDFEVSRNRTHSRQLQPMRREVMT